MFVDQLINSHFGTSLCPRNYKIHCVDVSIRRSNTCVVILSIPHARNTLLLQTSLNAQSRGVNSLKPLDVGHVPIWRMHPLSEHVVTRIQGLLDVICNQMRPHVLWLTPGTPSSTLVNCVIRVTLMDDVIIVDLEVVETVQCF